MDLKEMKITFTRRADGQFTINFEGFPEEQYIPEEYFDEYPALWVNRKGELVVKEKEGDEGEYMVIGQGVFCNSASRQWLMHLINVAAPRLRAIMGKPEYGNIGEEEIYKF